MSCSICLNSLENLITTPCNHEFCNGCLTKWLLNNNCCPMCRHNIGHQKCSDEDEDEDNIYDIDIYEEMEDGVSKRFRSDIEEYNEAFLLSLYELIDNIDDPVYLEDEGVKKEDGRYIMYVDFEEKNKTISALISYSPENNSADFTYSMKYKTRMNKKRCNRVRKNINNRKVKSRRNFKC